MKKAIGFGTLILAGGYFFDNYTNFLEPKFKGKAYIVSVENNKKSLEKIKLDLQSFGITYDEFKPKSSTQSEKHKEIWQKIIKTDETQAIILEDNVYFEKRFKQNLRKYIQDLPQDWDIAFLVVGRENDRYGYFVSVGDIFRDIDEVEGHPYVARIQKTNQVYGLYGYIINQKGAQKLLKLTKNESQNLSDTVFQKGGINTGYIKAYVSMFKLLKPKLTKTNVDSFNSRK